MSEYLARVSWDNILRYRKIMDSELKEDRLKRYPLVNQYGSDQRVMNKIKFGDGLWLFTAPLFGKGKKKRILPPTILGRISITHQRNIENGLGVLPANGAPEDISKEFGSEIIDISGKYMFWRGGTPRDVLPINNAFSLLKSLTFNGLKKEIDPNCKKCNSKTVPKYGPFGHLMQHFQSIRSLTEESTCRLNKLYEYVPQRRVLFLSHRRKEAGGLIMDIAKNLKDEALIWWDIQEIPQTAYYEDDLLTNILNDGVRQAGWFIAFITPDYFKSTWTAKEWENAILLSNDKTIQNRPKILPILLGGSLPGVIEIEKPIDVESNSKIISNAIRERI